MTTATTPPIIKRRSNTGHWLKIVYATFVATADTSSVAAAADVGAVAVGAVAVGNGVFRSADTGGIILLTNIFIKR